MSSIHRPAPLPQVLVEVDRAPAPVACRATDYPAGWQIAPHAQAKHQLVHAVQGVMVVQAAAGRWVIPPTRGLWLPAGMELSLIHI